MSDEKRDVSCRLAPCAMGARQHCISAAHSFHVVGICKCFPVEPRHRLCDQVAYEDQAHHTVTPMGPGPE